MTGKSLQALAEAMGILPSWRDHSGELRTTTPETQRALLKAMGVAADTEAEAAESLRVHHVAAAARCVPEELVITLGADGRIPPRPPNRVAPGA